MLFFGILGREITMDINDVQDDMDHGVRTVPVVYGRKFASTIGLTCSLGVVGLALSGPLLELLGGSTKVVLRRLTLAGLGSLVQLRRYWQVFQSEGQDSIKNQRAVEEGLLSVVVLLASFV
jgi:4-hydroxybenzoate polyprenyltransferase